MLLHFVEKTLLDLGPNKCSFTECRSKPKPSINVTVTRRICTECSAPAIIVAVVRSASFGEGCDGDDCTGDSDNTPFTAGNILQRIRVRVTKYLRCFAFTVLQIVL